jgi:hypothetical protein
MTFGDDSSRSSRPPRIGLPSSAENFFLLTRLLRYPEIYGGEMSKRRAVKAASVGFDDR